MSRRPRSSRPLGVRLRAAVGVLVAVGYLAGLGATTAGRGLALGAHVATEHAGPAPPALDDHDERVPETPVAELRGQNHATTTLDVDSPRHAEVDPSRYVEDAHIEPDRVETGHVEHTHVEHTHVEHAHSEHGAHRHAVSTEGGRESGAADVETTHVEVDRTEVTTLPAGYAVADVGAVHAHGERAHRHDVPEPPPSAPPPVTLDKHRLPERPALLPPPTSGAVVNRLADAWASAEGSVETPPPRARG